jgi:hypothetical protein
MVRFASRYFGPMHSVTTSVPVLARVTLTATVRESQRMVSYR